MQTVFSFPFSRCAFIMLVALSWTSLAFCGEIHEAAERGDLAKVKALLRDHPDLVFSKTEVDWTPLHHAALDGQNNSAEFRLAAKAMSEDGWTPLHFAASAGRIDVAALLLANKADVNR